MLVDERLSPANKERVETMRRDLRIDRAFKSNVKFSFIHLEDIVKRLQHLCEDSDLSPVTNLAGAPVEGIIVPQRVGEELQPQCADSACLITDDNISGLDKILPEPSDLTEEMFEITVRSRPLHRPWCW